MKSSLSVCHDASWWLIPQSLASYFTRHNKISLLFFFPEKQHCHSDISYNLNRNCKHFITLTIYTATFLSSSAYYFWHVKRPKESERKKKNLSSVSSLLLFLIFPWSKMIAPSPFLWHTAVQWGMNSCIYIFLLLFLVSVLWFIVMCFFTLLFCIVSFVLHQKLYYRYNIDTFTYGRCIDCTINLSWRFDRCWHQDANVFFLFLLTLA